MQEMNKTNIRAIHIGISGFPFGSAAINKCIAVYKALLREGIDVLVLNNEAKHDQSIPYDLRKEGEYEGLKYYYTTPSPYKSSSFLKRRISGLRGEISEFFFLVKKLSSKQADVLIYYPDGLFYKLIYYRILSKLFNSPIISHYVEFKTGFSNKKSLRVKLSDILFDRFFADLVDGVLPISEFLINQLKKNNSQIPYLKIPPLCDFQLFEKSKTINKTVPDKYFLYVGGADYKWALEQILKSFRKIEAKEFMLYLVLNGTAEQLKVGESIVESYTINDRVKVFSKISYDELIDKYINAEALLIPLSDNIQDEARFPQKISEYLASGKPIITNNCGEIRYYFKDNENAFIAPGNSIDDFAAKMKYVIENPDQAKLVGAKGHDMGLKYFDINSYRIPLKEFITEIISKG